MMKYNQLVIRTKSIKQKTLISILLLIAFLAILSIAGCSSPKITDFESCVAAGNPVMESYPSQCRADGQLFVEQVDFNPETQLSYYTCTEEDRQSDVCTLEYNPVCGMIDNGIRCITSPCPAVDAVTFTNGCSACSLGAYGHYPGECENHKFVVCNGNVNMFDPRKFADDYGGICVDICPRNYDPYVTQTGISLCIEHHGTEEIASWPVCDRSSNACNCVKAYETTREEQIVNPDYRCVPEQYAERLLFRSGQDRLDEDGNQEIMIA